MALLGSKKNAEPTEPKAPKVKKELTAEQVKMRNMLIVMGVLAVITAAIYLPGMFASKPSPPVAIAPAPEETATAAAPEGTPKPEGAKPEGEGTKPEGEGTKPEGETPKPVAVPAGSKAQLRLVGQPVKNFRPDPFEGFYGPVIVPDPTPTPIPSVPIPMPRPAVLIPRPGGFLPSQASDAMVALPPVHVSRISERTTVPLVQRGFPRMTGKAASLNPDDVPPAYSRRLSGVIIGDGVRALLEINTGEEIVTRVVQPGDQVDGITVLSIQRVTVGNQQVMRMIIRENNEEKYVDLKPSDKQQNQPAGGQTP